MTYDLVMGVTLFRSSGGWSGLSETLSHSRWDAIKVKGYGSLEFNEKSFNLLYNKNGLVLSHLGIFF